jgi:hypothetical protein
MEKQKYLVEFVIQGAYEVDHINKKEALQKINALIGEFLGSDDLVKIQSGVEILTEDGMMDDLFTEEDGEEDFEN